MPRSCPHCSRETKAKSFLCGKCEMPHLAYLKQETRSPEERMLFEFFSERQLHEMYWYTKYKLSMKYGSYLLGCERAIRY